MIKKILFFSLAAFILVGCNGSHTFSVEGNISNADNQTLYFEHNGLVKDSIIDSVKLKTNGDFKFKTHSPEYPDLYRLRLGNQQIMLGVDSTEKISVKADAKDLINAEISNSIPSADIQKLRKSVLQLQNLAVKIGEEKNEATQKLMLDSFNVDLATHKKMVMDLILKNPRSIAAYFALYQQVNGLYVMSPYEKEDLKYYSAVATSFDSYMPDYERSKNLHTLVISIMQQNRDASQQKLLKDLQAQSGVSFPEIELKDNKGNSQKLSALEGKTIVLDFSAAAMDSYVDYTFALRDIYNKYHAQGLQIYQVSLDDNEMLWKQSTENLPWICVRDANGTASRYAATYNVTNIPTLFLIDKQGNIVGKFADFDTLNKEIKRVM